MIQARLLDCSPAFSKLLPEAGLLAVQLDLPSIINVEGLADAWSVLHQRWTGTTKAALRNHPVAAAYIDLYRQSGINPKDHPPAAMNLVQRFLLGPSLTRVPRINVVVDCVNLAAAQTLVPLAVLDADALALPLLLDLSSSGDEFLGFGYKHGELLPPGTPVLRDRDGIVSVFCYRDGQAFGIKPETRSVVLLACCAGGIEPNLPQEALERALALLQTV